ncbi:MAG: O-acetylhomoserine (thiol)-lyase [Chloroflexota bacterium]|nr:O-acetylhomoserine (thiol)-lyase [Chloroflexota bacterium]
MTPQPREYGFTTRQLHAGQTADPTTHACAVPIYQTSSYTFDNTQHAADLFALKKPGNIYTRIQNPTTAVFEERVANLEGGVGALAASSGLAAQMLAILTILQAGDHIVASTTLYGGTTTQLIYSFKRMGIETTLVDADDPQNFRRAIQPNTKLLYGETLGNPLINVFPFEEVAQIAQEFGIPLMIDNTFASPYLARPIEYGANIVVQSATKFIGGHGTSIGGVIVDGGNFQWAGNERFPNFNQPDDSYHGLVYAELGADAFIQKARAQVLRDLGSCLSPFNAFLFLLGLETLSLRVERHVANAQKVAEFLDQHSEVEWVAYPGLKDNPYHAAAQKYLPKGPGSILGFGIKGGIEAGARFIDRLQVFTHLANVGDARSLAIHPGSTTHGQLSEEQQKASGISPEFIRLSIGLEDIDDILWDLDQALSKA